MREVVVDEDVVEFGIQWGGWSIGLTDVLAIRCEGEEFRRTPEFPRGLSHCMNGGAIYLPGKAWGKSTVLLLGIGEPNRREKSPSGECSGGPKLKSPAEVER